MNTCNAVILSGVNAGHKCSAPNLRILHAIDSDYCGTHNNSVKKHGPNAFALMTLKAVEYTKKQNELEKSLLNNEIDQETYEDRLDQALIAYKEKRKILVREQKNKIEETGIDPDAEIKAKKKQDRLGRIERLARIRRYYEERILVRNAGQVILPQDHLANDQYVGYYEERRNRINPRVNVNEDIHAFAFDDQSVHTTVVNNQTQTIIEKVLNIAEIPEEYKWSETTCSKTPSEVIAECTLTQLATYQMMRMYCTIEHDNVTERMGEGIYGRTLDAVWQFIKHSSDRKCLTKTLKTELEDNIGMCHEGNLSRLANVLAGYIDGISFKKSIEIVQDEFPKLMEISDVNERKSRGIEILKEQGIAEKDWDNWLDALVV